MGALIQPPGSGSGRRRRGAYRPMAEINVTPFVDVMLVLLIVFMVAAPLLTVGVKVDLPQTSAKPMAQDEKPLAVTVKADGTVYIMDEEVAFEELVPRLQAIAEARRDDRIYVRGDASVPYGRMAEVMGALNGAGFPKVALVTEPLRQAPKSGR